MPCPLSMVVSSCTLGSMTMSFLAFAPPKTMIRSRLPSAGIVVSSWPLTSTWMTAPPAAAASGIWATLIRFVP